MFYLDYYPTKPDQPDGYVNLSTSSNWERWLRCVLPDDLHSEVKARLVSNAKHILVGLEMKAGLIIPHAKNFAGKSVLFEPYCQIMTFEFCVGVFSICEGIGSSLHIINVLTEDGSKGSRVNPDEWIHALVSKFDSAATNDLESKVRIIKTVRDKMHQDKLGLRSSIDWHDFDYTAAFVPAFDVLSTLFTVCNDRIPRSTNLT